MTSEANFLAAIREDPEDDAVRLIFADWLEEQGEADRAEFIRVQVELAGLCPADRCLDDLFDSLILGPDDPRARDLLDREQEFLALHRDEWVGGLDEIAEEVVFQRGLPEKVIVKAKDFEQRGERLFENRAVREVRLTSLGRRGAALAKCPHLEQVQGMEFLDYGVPLKELMALLTSARLTDLRRLLLYGGLGIGDVAALAEAPCTQHLRQLFVGDLRDEDWKALLAWPSHGNWSTLNVTDSLVSNFGASVLARLDLAHLARLKLSYTDIDAAGASALAVAPWLHGLRELDLSGNPLGNAGVTSLFQSPHLDRLTLLDLSLTRIGATGIEALPSSPALGSLTTLQLRGDLPAEPLTAALLRATAPRLRILALGSSFSPEQIQKLGNASGFPALEVLRLGGGRLNSKAVANLGRSNLATSLISLDLSGNGIGDIGARTLAQAPNFTRLTSLDLRRSRLGPDGIVALASASSLTNLRRLDLRGNKIGVKGVRALAAASHLESLEELHLPRGLGEMAVRALAKSPHFRRLRRLTLQRSNIGDEGVKALADSTCLPSLRELDLSSHPLTNEEAALFTASSWMQQLYALHLNGSGLSSAARKRLHKHFGHRVHLGGETP